MAPVTPVAPVAPVKPVNPVYPVAPVNPVNPVAPVEPVLPITPIDVCKCVGVVFWKYRVRVPGFPTLSLAKSFIRITTLRLAKVCVGTKRSQSNSVITSVKNDFTEFEPSTSNVSVAPSQEYTLKYMLTYFVELELATLPLIFKSQIPAGTMVDCNLPEFSVNVAIFTNVPFRAAAVIVV